MTVPTCLTIATSDSGGGAGIQADLKAFAAAGCHGASAIVALTAQSTMAVTEVFELPPAFVVAQLDAVFGDLRVAAAKTGMLFSRELIETVADYLSGRAGAAGRRPGDGRELRREAAAGRRGRRRSSQRLFPLATVVTPNLYEAVALARVEAPRAELAERIHALGAAAVIVTGGHGDDAVDHLFDGRDHLEIPVARHDVAATHGAGCTHSATLAALLARGSSRSKTPRAGRPSRLGSGRARPRRSSARARGRSTSSTSGAKEPDDPHARRDPAPPPRAPPARPPDHELRRDERDRQRDARARRAARDGARARGGRGDGRLRRARSC